VPDDGPARITRWLLPSRTAVGLAALAVALGGAWHADRFPALQPAAALQQLAAVPLTDDDEDQALFDDSRLLVPGQPQVRCLRVRAEHGSTGAVQVYADHVSGALAPHLQVTVEHGSGGSATDCTGFSGQLVFHGTLDQLAATGEDRLPGVPTGWTTSGGDERSFRIAVEPRHSDQAQALAAGADLVWALVGEPPVASPQSSPRSSPQPGHQPSPSPSPRAAPTPVPAPPAPAAAPAGPGPIPAPAPAAAAGLAGSPDAPAQEGSATPDLGAGQEAARAPDAEPDQPAGAESRPGSAGPAAAPAAAGGREATPRPDAPAGPLGERLHALAAAVAQRSEFPVSLLSVLLLFLWVQRRLDRRDPKLALAPLYAEPSLFFPHPLAPPPTGAPREQT
jgi:hypothetical protein